MVPVFCLSHKEYCPAVFLDSERPFIDRAHSHILQAGKRPTHSYRHTQSSLKQTVVRAFQSDLTVFPQDSRVCLCNGTNTLFHKEQIKYELRCIDGLSSTFSIAWTTVLALLKFI